MFFRIEYICISGFLQQELRIHKGQYHKILVEISPKITQKHFTNLTVAIDIYSFEMLSNTQRYIYVCLISALQRILFIPNLGAYYRLI